ELWRDASWPRGFLRLRRALSTDGVQLPGLARAPHGGGGHGGRAVVLRRSPRHLPVGARHVHGALRTSARGVPRRTRRSAWTGVLAAHAGAASRGRGGRHLPLPAGAAPAPGLRRPRPGRGEPSPAARTAAPTASGRLVGA